MHHVYTEYNSGRVEIYKSYATEQEAARVALVLREGPQYARVYVRTY